MIGFVRLGRVDYELDEDDLPRWAEDHWVGLPTCAYSRCNRNVEWPFHWCSDDHRRKWIRERGLAA